MLTEEGCAYLKTIQAPSPERELRQAWQRYHGISSAKTYLQDIDGKKRYFIHLSKQLLSPGQQASSVL